jgi:hypothetical protein
MLFKAPNGIAHDRGVIGQQYLDGHSIPNEKEREFGYTISNSRLFVRCSTDRLPSKGNKGVWGIAVQREVGK